MHGLRPYLVFGLIPVFVAALGIAYSYGISAYAITGSSMEPTLREFDLAIVQRVNPATIRVGDIIAYTVEHFEEETIVHRVVEVKDVSAQFPFETKGDANPSLDDVLATPTYANLVYGKVVASIPVVGLIAIRSAALTISGVSILVIVLILRSMRNRPSEQAKSEDASNQKC